MEAIAASRLRLARNVSNFSPSDTVSSKERPAHHKSESCCTELIRPDRLCPGLDLMMIDDDNIDTKPLDQADRAGSIDTVVDGDHEGGSAAGKAMHRCFREPVPFIAMRHIDGRPDPGFLQSGLKDGRREGTTTIVVSIMRCTA